MKLRLRRRRLGKLMIVSTVAAAIANLRRRITMPQAPIKAPNLTPQTSHTINVKLRVNGTAHTLQIEPRVTLLDALREYIGLTGSKKGCDHGQCGACTVLADGRRINSCLSLAVMYDDVEITTIEGLAHGDELHPVQTAFIKHDGFQCGYCTPGQIMSAVALLKEGCPTSDEGIRECMSGNICRCGAYPGIVAAVQEVRASQG
ncbi:MAG: 2Fe-2S iron-sulfur cluster binding domain-containing protein [Tolypothrix carrinoi HA7290-LM1]|nr:2Fe-2S iron-sulfur cluster binding domain-containing protein [Tolypothrix carrinoi HA7290-LM1]